MDKLQLKDWKKKTWWMAEYTVYQLHEYSSLECTESNF